MRASALIGAFLLGNRNKSYLKVLHYFEYGCIFISRGQQMNRKKYEIMVAGKKYGVYFTDNLDKISIRSEDNTNRMPYLKEGGIGYEKIKAVFLKNAFKEIK